MPSYLNLTRTTYKVTDFLSWARNSELSLSPSFQRRPVWRPSAKSYFIDTVVRGLPVPIVFVREITDTKTLKTVREIVDGQQRIRTLISYVNGALLPDWKKEQDEFTVQKSHNSELAGKNFDRLDERQKSLIINYEISTHILPPDTSDTQVLDIFRRMNATGTKLNDQELRNAQFHGEFIQSVYGLSLDFLDRWRAWGMFTEYDIARMQEAEFLSEIYILVLRGISERTQSFIDSVYEDYEVTFKERSAVERRVATTFESIEKSVDVRSTVFRNRILFYPLFAAFYDVLYGLGSTLSSAAMAAPPARSIFELLGRERALSERVNLPSDVYEALLSRSNRKSNRQALFSYLRSSLVST